ncbi:hypothetical protein ABZX75_09615 [Streptomyces sp. NPDC003038]|uniref:hypothetical protein n=1 Tax=unclassified Streptomyces TaxID=2593676 RepID=UPI0033B6C0BE
MEPHTEATLVPPLASLPLPRPVSGPVEPPQPPDGHTTTTADRGSFCLAVCTCGWAGPARRSRDLARRDATRHSTA